jgi:PAS domain S-box-containing protein
MPVQAVLRATLEPVSDPAVITGPGDTPSIAWVNSAFERVYGTRLDAIAGRTLEEVLQLAPDDHDPGVTIARGRDGGSYRLRRHRQAIRDTGGDVSGWVEVQSLVTGGRSPAHPIEGNFRELFDGLREPLVIHADGRLVHVNQAFAELLGFDPRDLVGRLGVELIHADDRKRVGALVHAKPPPARTGATPEHRLVRKDGSSVHVEVYSVPIRHEGVVMSLSFARDLTERKRIDAQLLTVDRLASIGRLAAAIGHEINNPLAYMLMTMEMMSKELDAPDLDRARLHRHVATIREGGERVRDIVRDLRTLVRDDREQRGAIDVHLVLDRCLELAEHEVRHRARVVRHYTTSRLVWANEARLQQVFLNLVINAAQAIQGGPHGEHEITLTTLDEGPDRVAIEITDTGVGVAPEDLEHVFEPFFTTKPVGIGTGLGLSICHHIVTSLGGTIALAPAATRGTAVRATLPAARPGTKLAAPRAARPSPPPSFTNARVLVVDDEPYLVGALASTLEHHDVTVAHGGQEAIDLLRGSAFDLIVSDLHMAEISGVDLYEHVRTTYPGLERRMIFMTGGAFTDRARRFLARVTPPVLEKPFDSDRLVAVVDALIAKRE